jgi:hypothetical protein
MIERADAGHDENTAGGECRERGEEHRTTRTAKEGRPSFLKKEAKNFCFLQLHVETDAPTRGDTSYGSPRDFAAELRSRK